MMVYFTLINFLISAGIVFAYHKLYFGKMGWKVDIQKVEDGADDLKEEEVEIEQVTTS